MDKKDLLAVRSLLGLTQKELAQRVGYSYSYIKMVESGRAPVTIQFVERVYKEVLNDEYDAQIQELVCIKADAFNLLEHEKLLN